MNYTKDELLDIYDGVYMLSESEHIRHDRKRHGQLVDLLKKIDRHIDHTDNGSWSDK